LKISFNDLRSFPVLLYICFIFSISLYSCEKINNNVIDPTYYAPLISAPQLSTDTVRTTSSNPLINFSTSITVNLNQGTPISNVKASLIFPDGAVVNEIFLNDNGAAPDITAGDGIYSGTFNFSNIQCLIVGEYRIEYVAENSQELQSNVISYPFPVINTANQPPVIVSTDLPESVVRPPQGGNPFPLTIRITANDPDGICDLKEASFVTERPNGVILPRIPMIYEGNGLFSFSALVEYSGDPTSYGYFKYTFRATDNSNVNSIEVKDSINFVYP
jgi:hypothetical protein